MQPLSRSGLWHGDRKGYCMGLESVLTKIPPSLMLQFDLREAVTGAMQLSVTLRIA